MTSIHEVEVVLSSIKDNELAQEWMHNDIIKMKLAQSYDDWLKDINDHKLYLSLEEHIETFLDNFNVLGDEIFQW